MDESEVRSVEARAPALVTPRQRAWTAGGALLLGLGGLLLAVGLIGLATLGGGAAILALAIPPAGVGYLVLRRIAAARTTAVSVALAYAAFALYVATAPLRGLTPPDGSGAPGPDLALLVLGTAFGAAALLLIIGKPER